jgi:hypothetical protein
MSVRVVFSHAAIRLRLIASGANPVLSPGLEAVPSVGYQ